MGKTASNIIYKNLLLLGILCSVHAFAKEGERHISLQQDIASAALVRLSVPAGEVEIIGITGNNLVAEVTAVCEDQQHQTCLQLLTDLDWAKKDGTTAEFQLMPAEISNFNDVTIKVKIGVPQDKKLEVNVGAGELAIEDTSACLTAALGAGEIDITLKESQLASATLSATVGDANLTTAQGEFIAGKRSLLVGANLDWQKGTAGCHTRATVAAGEAKLLLK